MDNSNGLKRKNKIQTVAIIPVRGNSKRIPGKNTKPFAAAMRSPEIDFVILTTESKKIADAAMYYVTAEYPDDYTRFNAYLRPPELSQDHVQTDEVILFTLRQMQIQGLSPETIVTLLATSPLRTADDVTDAVRLYYRHSPCTVISGNFVDGFYWKASLVSDRLPLLPADQQPIEPHPYIGRFELLGYPLEDNPAERPGTQFINRFDKLFKEDGAIYVNDAEELELHRTKMVGPFVMHETGISTDIDTKEDWEHAERLINYRKPEEQLGSGEEPETEIA
jgi:CMP-N-acetylneuraminic acid synthetase